MKMTYDDFEPGHWYKTTTGRVLQCRYRRHQLTQPKFLVDFFGGSLMKLRDAIYHLHFLGECDREGNLIEPEVPIHEDVDFLHDKINELERKLLAKEKRDENDV